MILQIVLVLLAAVAVCTWLSYWVATGNFIPDRREMANPQYNTRRGPAPQFLNRLIESAVIPRRLDDVIHPIHLTPEQVNAIVTAVVLNKDIPDLTSMPPEPVTVPDVVAPQPVPPPVEHPQPTQHLLDLEQALRKYINSVLGH